MSDRESWVVKVIKGFEIRIPAGMSIRKFGKNQHLYRDCLDDDLEFQEKMKRLGVDREESELLLDERRKDNEKTLYKL